MAVRTNGHSDRTVETTEEVFECPDLVADEPAKKTVIAGRSIDRYMTDCRRVDDVGVFPHRPDFGVEILRSQRIA